jgi:hypothetical protein
MHAAQATATDLSIERRRAPRALRLPKDMLEEGAHPASTTELARWTGMSDDFIRGKRTPARSRECGRARRAPAVPCAGIGALPAPDGACCRIQPACWQNYSFGSAG